MPSHNIMTHLQSTRRIPKERQTMIDLKVVKDLVETTVVKIKRVLTTHMLADILTKNMPMNETFWKFYVTRRHSLRQNKEEAASPRLQ